MGYNEHSPKYSSGAMSVGELKEILSNFEDSKTVTLCEGNRISESITVQWDTGSEAVEISFRDTM